MIESGQRERAALRGLEAVAHSRINVGVWTARLFGALNGLNAGLAAFLGLWRVAGVLALWSGTLILTSTRIAKGSRIDAWVLLGLFLTGDIAFAISRPISVFAIGISVATFIGMVTGLRGVMTLARVRREWLALERSEHSAGTQSRLSKEELKPSAAASSLVE